MLEETLICLPMTEAYNATPIRTNCRNRQVDALLDEDVQEGFAKHQGDLPVRIRCWHRCFGFHHNTRLTRDVG